MVEGSLLRPAALTVLLQSAPRLRLSLGSFADRQTERRRGEREVAVNVFSSVQGRPPQLQLQPSFPPPNGCRAGEMRGQGHRRSPQSEQESGKLKGEMKVETEQNQKSS